MELINFALIAFLTYLIFKVKNLLFASILILLNIISLIIFVSAVGNNNSFDLMELKYYDQQCFLNATNTVICQSVGPTTVETISISNELVLVFVWLITALVIFTMLYKYSISFSKLNPRL